jgi:hypothetical protein
MIYLHRLEKREIVLQVEVDKTHANYDRLEGKYDDLADKYDPLLKISKSSNKENSKLKDDQATDKEIHRSKVDEIAKLKRENLDALLSAMPIAIYLLYPKLFYVSIL